MNFSNVNINDLQKSLKAAILVFQKALGLTLPGSQVLDTGTQGPLFWVDFVYESSFNSELQADIQQRIRKIVKEDEEIIERDMLLTNAQAFLAAQGQTERLVGSFPKNALGSFLQLDTILEFNEGISPKTTSEAGFCQIISIQDHSFGVRVWGSAFQDKKVTKEFVKQWNRETKKKYPWALPLSKEKTLVFYGRGLEEVKRLKKDYSDVTEGDELYTGVKEETLQSVHLQAFRKTKKNKHVSYEWISADASPRNYELDDPFFVHHPLRDVQFRFCKKDQMEAELISSLQFIERAVKIENLNYEWQLQEAVSIQGKLANEWKARASFLKKVLSKNKVKLAGSEKDPSLAFGPSIRLMLIDSLGRRWPGSQVTWVVEEGVKDIGVIRLNLYLSVQKWLELKVT